MSPPCKLLLIRHGHTLWHESGRVAGRSDVALSDFGRVAVKRLAKTLSTAQVQGQWFSSPMQRSCETARILRDPVNLIDPAASTAEPVLDARLCELDFGDWEGMSWQDVHALDGQKLKAWSEDWVNRAPPNGETFARQAYRCREFLLECASMTESRDEQPRQLVVIAHGGTIRALLCICMGWPLSKAMSVRIDLATVCNLDQTEPQGHWLLRSVNALHG